MGSTLTGNKLWSKSQFLHFSKNIFPLGFIHQVDVLGVFVMFLYYVVKKMGQQDHFSARWLSSLNEHSTDQQVHASWILFYKALHDHIKQSKHTLLYWDKSYTQIERELTIFTFT